MIIPLLEEVVVVHKQLMLKEELHITRRRVADHATQEVTLRQEQATIERIAPSTHPEQEDPFLHPQHEPSTGKEPPNG
jgi:stress response protein YsnF